jgi:hypothetical protein
MRDFGEVLAWLRARPHPCAPPIGVGEFDVLYASAREVVVWYTPARDGHRTGEVAIPCARLAAAWEALQAGTPLDEPALARLGAGIGVQSAPLALTWSSEPEPAPAPPPAAETPATPPAVHPAARAHPRRRRPRTATPAGDAAIVEPRSAAPTARQAKRQRP